MLSLSKPLAARLLLLGVITAANAESERCVPAAEGGWRCGKNVTEADAAPLPERQSRTLPPVMLIDPARFGEGDIDIDTPLEAPADTPAASAPAAETPSPAAANSATTQILPTAAETLPLAETETSAAPTKPESSDVASGNFAVQLAVASSPRGFDALLAKLGAAARTSERRQLANGSWVLLIGRFNSIAQARNAIPSSIPGAFARDISTLNFR